MDQYKIVKDIDHASIQLKYMLMRYEEYTQHIILNISGKNSLEDANELFNLLEEIQKQLSSIEFKYEIHIGDKLFQIVQNLDRLDDNFLRDYWFKQFKKGITWPACSC